MEEDLPVIVMSMPTIGIQCVKSSISSEMEGVPDSSRIGTDFRFDRISRNF